MIPFMLVLMLVLTVKTLVIVQIVKTDHDFARRLSQDPSLWPVPVPASLRRRIRQW